MPEHKMQHLRELQEIATAIRAAQALDTLRPLFYRLGEIAAASGDIDVLASVGDRKREIAEAGARLGHPIAAAAAASASTSAPLTPPPLQNTGMLPTALMPLPESGVTQPMPSHIYKPPATARNWPMRAALAAALAVLVAAGTWAGLRYAGSSKTMAALDGRRPAEPPNVPAADTVSTDAQSLRLQISLDQATLSFDGASPIRGGVPPAGFDNIAPGKHTVRLSSQDAEAIFHFVAAPGKQPVVDGAVAARGAVVFLVSHSGGAARLVTGAGSWNVSVNGQPEGEAGPAGLDLKHWKNGSNEFALSGGSEQIRFQAASERGPSLAAIVLPATNAPPPAGPKPSRAAVIPLPSAPKPASLDEPPPAAQPVAPAPAAVATPFAPPALAPAKPADAPSASVKSTPVARKRGGIVDFAEPAAWRTDGDVSRNTRPGFHAYGATGPGLFQFDVIVEHGGKARWTVGYMDANNYRLFEIDGESLSVFEVVRGARTRVARAPLAASKEKRWRVRIDVAPSTVAHAVYQAGSWNTLDAWSVPARDLSAGRFGFLIQGQERIALSGFLFEPR